MITRSDLEKFRKQKIKELKKQKVELNFNFLDLIREFPDATYYMAFGERSGGKTYTALDYALERWKFDGKTIAYIRRFDEALKPKRAQQLFSPFEKNGYIEFITEGQYDCTVYRVGRWYFAKRDPETGKPDNISPEPFAYAFALSQVENDKSASFPDTDTIFFDEFLTRDYYFPNEFALLMNIISTIVRFRIGVKILMAANTVNQYNPYFGEMGLTHAPDLAPGGVECYNYGDSRLQVVVTHTEAPKQGKPSDYYFAFDNPRLKMVTESAWEIDIYPHYKGKIKNRDILYTFFILFDNNTLKCDVIRIDGGGAIINIVPHTGEIKDPETLIYSPEISPLPNHRVNVMKPFYPIEQKIATLFKMDKVFYGTNQCGEVVRNYLKYCEY